MVNAKLRTASLSAIIAFATPACMFNHVNSIQSSLSASPSATPTTTPTGSGTLRISNVTIAMPAGSRSATPTTTIFFETAGTTDEISNHCNQSTGAQASKPCLCEFTWQEINQTSGSSVAVNRIARTSTTAVQRTAVACLAPGVYPTEIPNGTQIRITVVPSTANYDTFTVTPYNYTKSTAVATGSFQDAQGHYFDNILHYSCYEQYRRGLSIKSRLEIANNPRSGETKTYPYASQFCVRNADGSGGGGQNCPHLDPVAFSSQAYYYNLFIRDSERGDINPTNDRYTCPRVRESLSSNGTLGSRGNYYPLDSTFALSLGPTPDFNVAVESFSKLSNGSDPTAQGSTCYSNNAGGGGAGGGGGGASNGTLIQSCLGFAAKPNSDGTCPSFRDRDNRLQYTYRLRKYIAIYPKIYDTNGSPRNESQASDIVFVLDRRVNYAGADARKPYTMRGPKPCPFSYYDRTGITGPAPPAGPAYPDGNRLPGYAATNFDGWNNTNVDGIQLPNSDSVNSCSAVLPILNSDKTVMSLITVDVGNAHYPSLYVRPIKAWAPHYEEDLSFEACAPEATPRRDPPLHFAKDSSGNVSWCAEVYPTQNDNVSQVDRNVGGGVYGGYVEPFTSHVVKHSASATCNFSRLESIPSGGRYPAASAGACPNAASAGRARHPIDLGIDTVDGVATCSDKTCDRTVSNSADGEWPNFPLLARPHKVEDAIIADASYNCTVSYDNGGSKTDKKSPSQGCCGTNVRVWTGAAPAAPYNKDTAHLEPDAPCLTPDY